MRVTTGWLLTAATALYCFSALPVPARTQSGETWAIIVGISKYQKLPGGQHLMFAERDALAFASALGKTGVKPQNVRSLIGIQATLAAVKSSIGSWLAQNASANDTVYIYFSGHGIVETAFNESYLLCYDSDPSSIYATALSLRDLQHALNQRSRAGKVIILADAVRRDFFDPERGSNEAKMFLDDLAQLAASRPGVGVINASRAGEFSREGQRWGGLGVFTKLVVDGINGAADLDSNGDVSLEELYDFAAAGVASETSNKQNPWRSQLPSFAIARITPQDRTVPPISKPRVEAPPSAVARNQPERRNDQVTSAPESKNRPSNPQPGPAGPTKTVPQPRQAKPQPVPPKTQEIAVARPPRGSEPALEKRTEPVDPLPPAPKPLNAPPTSAPVTTAPPARPDEAMSRPVSTAAAAPAPSPLPLQFEAALAAGNLIEPKEVSAWDIFQRINQESNSQADIPRLRSMLRDALLAASREITSSDIRVDNVTNKVDDFRRAGQIIARARSLDPSDEALPVLEKLSAAGALIALQFYEEAERALGQLQNARLAAVENALGIVYQGQLDEFRAERAYKRAIEIDPNLASAHYNLGLLYRSQKKDEAATEFERAAVLGPNNVVYHTALGDEYFARSKWVDAAACYRKAAALHPTDDALQTKLGHALFSQGLRDEADKAYRRAQELRRK